MKLNRATLSRNATHAGFEPAPLMSVEKGCSSIFKYGPPLSSGSVAHTNDPGLL
jgi:hypothetical protein